MSGVISIKIIIILNVMEVLIFGCKNIYFTNREYFVITRMDFLRDKDKSQSLNFFLNS